MHEDPEKGHVHCQHFNSNKKLTRLSRHAPCSVCLVYLSVALNPKTLNPKQMSCNLVTKDHRVRMPHILAMRKSYIYIIKRILKILIITYIINEKIKTVIFEVDMPAGMHSSETNSSQTDATHSVPSKRQWSGPAVVLVHSVFPCGCLPSACLQTVKQISAYLLCLQTCTLETHSRRLWEASVGICLRLKTHAGDKKVYMVDCMAAFY